MSNASIFLARALAEAARYGQDEWVFLRELAQNARDAGATRIEVTTGSDAHSEWVVFADDGAGMTLAHARRYFFRLYASSKETDATAAGRFGVGFWAVLRWQPSQITVESRTVSEGWARLFTGSLEEAEATSSLAGPGTRITLRRPRRLEDVALAVAVALRRYCRYLRRAGQAVPLPLLCDGVEINERLELAAPSLSFCTADAEGAVGLEEHPRVELWARGLLVAEVSLLDELDTDQPVPAQERRSGGLAPVILLHGDRLELCLSRQAARRGRVLRRMLRLARGRVDRLVRHVLDDAAPQPFWERLGEWTRQPFRRLTAAHVAVAALFLTLVGVAAVLLRVVSEPNEWVLPPGEPSRITVRAEPLPVVERRPSLPSLLPYTDLGNYGGAVVEVPDPSTPPWGLRYEGPAEVLFRLAALERYDPQRGFVVAPSPKSDHPAHRCVRECVQVHLEVIAPRGPLAIPVPTGHRLVPHSLRLVGGPRPTALLDGAGDVFVELPPGLAGVLTYETGPYAGGRRPVLPPPRTALPLWATRAVERQAHLPPVRRAEVLTQLVRDRLTYDASPVIAAAFGAATGDWLSRVLTVGAGDCDVKNGVNVLLLRRAGIPARLAMGIVGRRGSARPSLHAWTEYFAGRWRVADATGSSPSMPAVGSAVESRFASSRRGVPPPSASAPFAVVAPPGVVAPLPTSGHAVDPDAGLPPAVAAPVTGPVVVGAASGRESLALAARFGGLLGGGLTVLLLVMAWRRRVREEVRAEDSEASRRALAGMVRDALAHPTVWRESGSLWQRRLLPTLNGRSLSVAEALARAENGRLFVSRQRSELARLAAKGGTPVLDGSEAVFAEAIAALGHAIDLDELDRLRPLREQDPAVRQGSVDALALVNAFLQRLRLETRCLLTTGLGPVTLRDVDLSALNLPHDFRLPRRLVALNPESSEVQARLAFLAREPRHGLLLWFDWLSDYSELLAIDASRLRERAALELLEAWR